jgi:hypothetical protein
MFIKCTIFALAALTFSSAHAHHSFAAGFTKEKITIEGYVDKFLFKNPHVAVYVNVTDKDSGEVTKWLVEGPAATGLRLAGWDKDTLNVGDFIRFTGDAGRDGRPMVSLQDVAKIDPNTGAFIQDIGIERHIVTPADPKSKDFHYPKTLENGLPNLNGIWVQGGDTNPEPSFLLNKDPVFNSAGQAMQKSIKASEDPQYTECAAPNLIRQAGFTPHPVKITQNENSVTFEYEEYAGKRVIYLDNRDYDKHKENTHSLMGRYKAHYEGDALIIKSDLLESAWSGIFGQITSDQATVVETYSRKFDKKWGPVLHLSMIITDPVYLQEPREMFWDKYYTVSGFTGTKSDNIQKDYTMIPVECHLPMDKKNETVKGK